MRKRSSRKNHRSSASSNAKCGANKVTENLPQKQDQVLRTANGDSSDIQNHGNKGVVHDSKESVPRLDTLRGTVATLSIAAASIASYSLHLFVSMGDPGYPLYLASFSPFDILPFIPGAVIAVIITVPTLACIAPFIVVIDRKSSKSSGGESAKVAPGGKSEPPTNNTQHDSHPQFSSETSIIKTDHSGSILLRDLKSGVAVVAMIMSAVVVTGILLYIFTKGLALILSSPLFLFGFLAISFGIILAVCLFFPSRFLRGSNGSSSLRLGLRAGAMAGAVIALSFTMATLISALTQAESIGQSSVAIIVIVLLSAAVPIISFNVIGQVDLEDALRAEGIGDSVKKWVNYMLLFILMIGALLSGALFAQIEKAELDSYVFIIDSGHTQIDDEDKQADDDDGQEGAIAPIEWEIVDTFANGKAVIMREEESDGDDRNVYRLVSLTSGEVRDSSTGADDAG